VNLSLLPERYSVCRLAPDAPLPPWATAGAFSSITRTPDELSIVCLAAAVPPGVAQEADWRVFRVAGPLDFALTGILASLAGPLAEAGVPIFAISTFDTDYLLIRGPDLDRAITVLTEAGHTFDR